MPKKTLYIHIGHYKSGTTALQGLCDKNQGKLRGLGLDYSRLCIDRNKHSKFAFAILHAVGVKSLMHGYASQESPPDLWRRLFAYVARAPQDKVLISSEEFIRIGGYPDAEALLKELITMAPDGVEVRAIVYLRSPQAHLRSWYNQLIKMRIITPDFDTAVSRFIEPVHFDYKRALGPWLRILGRERVIIRPYIAPEGEGTALYQDFFGALGIDADLSRFSMPDGDARNPRIPEDMLELVRVMRNAGVGEDVVHRTRGRVRAWMTQERSMIPDFEREVAEVARLCKESLTVFDNLPHSAINPADFAADLPRSDSGPALDESRVLGIALGELNVLRQGMFAEVDALQERVSQLEKALKIKSPKKKS